MPGAGAVVQGRQTLGMADENEGGGGFAPVGVTNHLGVVGRGAVDGRERQRDLTRSTAWVDQSRRSLAERMQLGALGRAVRPMVRGSPVDSQLSPVLRQYMCHFLPSPAARIVPGARQVRGTTGV